MLLFLLACEPLVALPSTDDKSCTEPRDWYGDGDDDGFGTTKFVLNDCEQPEGYVDNADDCDDNNFEIGNSLNWYADTDGDGHGDIGALATACAPAAGEVATSDDCDDADSAVFPGAAEYCNGTDDDCDGDIDDEDDGVVDQATFYADDDQDGYGDDLAPVLVCPDAAGDLAAVAGDCDDLENDVHPDSSELCNGIDDNCDGDIDSDGIDPATWYLDLDGDGYGRDDLSVDACDQPASYVDQPGDCNDELSAINPAATETCDGVDNDCEGSADLGADNPTSWYADLDADTFGDPAASVSACDAPAGYVADATDCEDADGYVFPGATELCNGIDDDCDADVDGNDPDVADQVVFYGDDDADGYGDSTAAVWLCPDEAGDLATVDGDCDDLRDSVHPNNSERCNGIDDDCDGSTDEDGVDPFIWYLDLDGDGFGRDNLNITACAQPASYQSTGGDCDDDDGAISPAATEVCDDVDNDCDGAVDLGAVDPATWYFDDDGDGFGDAAAPFAACDAPGGYVSDATDCDDAASASFPGGVEVCGGADENCDGAVDEATAVDAPSWYADADLDGYGSGAGTVACVAPADLVDNIADCDDGNIDISPDAVESCADGVDDNCDGVADDGCGPSGDIHLDDADAKIEWPTNSWPVGYRVLNAGDLTGFGAESMFITGTYGGPILSGPTSAATDGNDTVWADTLYSMTAMDVGGDWNGDGQNDLLMADSSAAYIYEGPITSYTLPAAAAANPGAAGASYLSLSDVDGDDYADVLSPWSNGGVKLDYGPYVGSEAYLQTTGGHSMYALDANEDLDGDGINDVLIKWDSYGVCIVSGAEIGSGLSDITTDTIATTILSFYGTPSAIPDTNGDGYADILSGYSTGGSNNKGEVYLYQGPVSTMVSGSPSATLTGPARDARAGNSTGSADVNGDGLEDILASGLQGDAWLVYSPVSGAIDLGDAHATWGGFETGRTLAIGGADLEGTGQDTIAIADAYAGAGVGALYLFHGGGQ